MSKLPASLRWQDVAKILTKLGYELVRRSSSHAIFTNREGRMVVLVTKSPIKRGTLEAIIDQTGVSREEFLRLA